jgi:hypothetical protein
MDSKFMKTALCAAVLCAAGTLALAQQATVAVFDFTIPAVSVRDYQNENFTNPLETPPDSLMDPAEMDKLPEEDRLAIMRREQEAMAQWQRQKRAIEVKRYEDRMEANSKVRDILLKTEEGRQVIQGVGIMEAALASHPDVFRVFRPVTADNRAQRNQDLQNQLYGLGGSEKLPEAPAYYVEGEVGDLDARTISQVSGPTTLKATFYRLPITIKMYEMGSGQLVGAYSEEVTTRDQSAGFAPKSRQEIMQTLLRQATKDAAARFAAAFRPAVQPVAQPVQPQGPIGYVPVMPMPINAQ